MFETNILVAGIIFGSIWTGYFIYWKKDQRFIFLLSWIVLMIFPYFIVNIYYMIAIWTFFLILPFIIKA